MVAPLKKEFNWSDVGVGVGAFGATAALGFAATAAEKSTGWKQLFAPLLPAAGAGFIAYWLRRSCPACPKGPMTIELPRERPTPMIGYGTYGVDRPDRPKAPGLPIITSPVIESEWVTQVSGLLVSLGYDVDIQSSTTVEFHQAVAAFQIANGLERTGWVDPATAGRLADLTGEAVATITPAGVGVEPEKKSRWPLYVGIGLGGVAITGVIIAVATSGK